VQLGQYPAPRHAIAHVSDPHLLADALQYGVIDTEAGVVRTLERLAHVDPPPQALVFTGDLADRADPAAYARLRELVEPAAAAMGAQVVWVMGNHDERGPFAAGLYDEPVDGEAATQDRVYDVDGLRIVALDTSVPGYHHGDLTDAQLAWLSEVLATPAPYGTLLALHHPPIPVPMLEPAAIIELLDQQRLADVLAGTDVRGILGGHFHFSTYSTFAGIPVSVASASCYTSDPAPAGRYISALDGHQAVTMLHLYDDRVVHTIVPLGAAPEVNGFPAEAAALVGAFRALLRRFLLSRMDSAFNAGEVTLEDAAP
jgi:3',5'-cyclic AMP phosphodiesterase CpdA